MDRELKVLNALLRCRRGDSRAAVLFQQVEQVPGLWVLELGPFGVDSWSGWMAETHHTLASNEPFLKSLRDGSKDYTLHITVDFSEFQAAVIPPSMSQILASCGIALELYQSVDEA